MPKYDPEAQKEVKKEMHEFKPARQKVVRPRNLSRIVSKQSQ